MRFRHTNAIVFVVVVSCILIVIFFEMVHVESNNDQKQRSPPLRGFEQVIDKQKMILSPNAEIGASLESEREILENSQPDLVLSDPIQDITSEVIDSNRTIEVVKDFLTTKTAEVNITLNELPQSESDTNLEVSIPIATLSVPQQLPPNYDVIPQVNMIESPYLALESAVVERFALEIHKQLIVKMSQTGQQTSATTFAKLSELHKTANTRDQNILEFEDFFPVSTGYESPASVDQFSFGVLERFHKALNTGSACPDSSVAAEYVDSVQTSVLQSVSDLIKLVSPKVLFEFAAPDDSGGVLNKKSVSFHVAVDEPKLTVVFVAGGRIGGIENGDAAASGTVNSCASAVGVSHSNLFESSTPVLTNQLLDRHAVQAIGSPSALECIQLVHSVGSLVQDQLPFEFEESFGTLLCRCGHTYLPKSLPSDEPFFAYWDHSMSTLVSAAIKAAPSAMKDSCAVSLDTGDSVSAKHLFNIRYSHVVAQRYDPRDNNGTGTDSFASSSGVPVTSNSTSVKDSGFMSVSLLSTLPLNARSSLSLSFAISNYIARSSRVQRHYNLTSVSVLSRSVNESDGSVSVLQDVDYRPSALAQWVDGLSVSGGELFDARENSVEALEEERRLLMLSEAQLGTSQRRSSAKLSPSSVGEGSVRVGKPVEDAVMGGAMRTESVSAVTPISTASPTNASDHALSAESLIDSMVAPFEAVSVVAGDSRSNPNGSFVVNTTLLAPESGTRRRRLYIPYSGSSARSVSSSSSVSASSNSAVSQQSEKQAPYSLMWELAERRSGDDESEADDTDSAIRHRITALEEKRTNNRYPPSSGSGGAYSLSSAARATHRLLREREDSAYRTWMHYLKLEDEEEERRSVEESSSTGLDRAQKARLVYVMGRQSTLLSIKLSKLMISPPTVARGGLVTSLLLDSAAVAPHEQLIRMLGLKNNIICSPTWSSPASFSALLGTPERAQVAVVQSDVIMRALSVVLADPLRSHQCEDVAVLFEEIVLSLLSLSDLSYVELPSPALLDHLLSRSSPREDDCVAYLASRYASRGAVLSLAAAQLPKRSIMRIQELPVPRWQMSGVLVEEESGARGLQVFRVSIEREESGRAADDVLLAARHSALSSLANKGASFGLSVYSAVHFGLVASQRRVLLNMLINIPLWSLARSEGAQLVPWRLFVRLSGSSWAMWYHDISTQNMHDGDGGASVSRHAASVSARMSSSERNARGSTMGISVADNDGTASSDRKQGVSVWKALQNELHSHSGELAGGKFSFVEHNSGYGYVSTRLAKSFPNATVISLERNPIKVQHHVSMAEQLGVTNNAVCQKAVDDSLIHKNLYESPELFRFQLRAHSLMEDFIAARSVSDWGESIGTLLSVALTTFIYAPNSAQVSWAMHLLFGEVYERRAECGDVGPCVRRHSVGGAVRPLSEVLGSSGHQRDEVSLSDILSELHPQAPYRDFESRWLLEAARVSGGQTTVMVSPLAVNELPSSRSKSSGEALVGTARTLQQLSLPLVRCDLVNMTRHVHHHYEYAKDGHSRTYTMRVRVNETLSDEVLSRLGDPSRSSSVQLESAIRLSTASTLLDHHQELFHNDLPSDGIDVIRSVQTDADSSAMVLPAGNHPNQHKTVSVQLFRDRDGFPIPYTSIYGVTLITALRLGLETTQREKLFGQFLRLPLYEDMAPWNVVLMGASLDYIDYDTREFTYTLDVPKAYRVMSVLMNYKRTVEDFKRCGSKAGTVYGLPYVSDCVGSVDKSLVCAELSLPVPCGDGKCHSDYISCLRSLSYQAEQLVASEKESAALALSATSQHALDQSMDVNLAAAMKAVVGRFDKQTFSAVRYEDFVQRLRSDGARDGQ